MSDLRGMPLARTFRVVFYILAIVGFGLTFAEIWTSHVTITTRPDYFERLPEWMQWHHANRPRLDTIVLLVIAIGALVLAERMRK